MIILNYSSFQRFQQVALWQPTCHNVIILWQTVKRGVKSFPLKMVSTSTPIFWIYSLILYTSPKKSFGSCWELHTCTESREPLLTVYIHVHFEWISTHTSGTLIKANYCDTVLSFLSMSHLKLNPLANTFTNY